MRITSALLLILLLTTPALAGRIVGPVSSELRQMVWQEENGAETSLASRRGKPVVLHFWAAWCTACGEELPSMVNWSRQQADTEVIYVSLDQRMAQARYFLDKHSLSIKARLGTMSDLATFGLRGLPATIFIDADGKESGRIIGAADWNDEVLTAEVRRFLDKKETD